MQLTVTPITATGPEGPKTPAWSAACLCTLPCQSSGSRLCTQQRRKPHSLITMEALHLPLTAVQRGAQELSLQKPQPSSMCAEHIGLLTPQPYSSSSEWAQCLGRPHTRACSLAAMDIGLFYFFSICFLCIGWFFCMYVCEIPWNWGYKQL